MGQLLPAVPRLVAADHRKPERTDNLVVPQVPHLAAGAAYAVSRVDPVVRCSEEEHGADRDE